MFLSTKGAIGSVRAKSGVTVLPALNSIPYTQMVGVDVSIHNVGNVGSQLDGVIGVSNDYTISWELIDPLSVVAVNGVVVSYDTVATGSTNSIDYTFQESDWNKSYDIKIVVSWQDDSIERYFRDGVRRVTYAKFDPLDPNVTNIDVSTHSGFQTAPFATSKIIFTGTRASGNMNLNNLSITNENVEIQCQDNCVINSTLVLGSTCSNVMINACCDNDIEYGLVVQPPLTTGDCIVLNPGQFSTQPFFEFYSENITLLGIQANLGIVGFHILPPKTEADNVYPVTQLNGYVIANCFAYQTDTEGFYLGWTRDYEGYAELFNPRYYYLKTQETGWDGMQPGNSIEIEIHHLDIVDPGLKFNSNQYSAFSINGVGNAIFHNITMSNHYKGFTGSTGLNHGNVQIFNCYIDSDQNESLEDSWYRVEYTSISPVLMAIYNNTFDTLKPPFGPYCHNCTVNGDTAQMNWQYEDNVELQTTNGTYTGNHLIDVAYTRHWLSLYDSNGYLI